MTGYINYQQDNWCELLTMAEFAYNNTISATTGITPFFALYGQHPRYIIRNKPTTNPVKSSDPTGQTARATGPVDLPTPAALQEWANQLDQHNSYQKTEMVYAQAVQFEQADKDRLPAPVYNIGDEVWLLRRHIHTSRPSSKLDFKRLGRFKILRRISSHTYELDLPTSMRYTMSLSLSWRPRIP